MVPADSDRILRVPPYSGYHYSSTYLPVRGCHPLRCIFPDTSRSSPYRSVVLQPRTCRNTSGLGSSHFARHYFGNRCFFLFLGVLRCFSSPRSPRLTTVHGLQPCGLPHSDISGSIPVCKSPELFAAYHVLLRLRKPRHPPFALILFLVLCESCRTTRPAYYSCL